MADARHDSRRPPDTVEEALLRARRHGRAAAGEAALAVRAVLDALSIATTGGPGEAHPAFAWVAAALEDAARGLGRETPGTASLLGAVAGALDAEIARWERRAASDRDARAVLRAYLGLREILWELGLRAPETAEPRPSGASHGERDAGPPAPRDVASDASRRRSRAARPARPARLRLERIPVDR